MLCTQPVVQRRQVDRAFLAPDGRSTYALLYTAPGTSFGGSAAGGSAPSLFSWALVCACNMNRSPSGHAELSRRGQARVSSFGTSDAVRLPGRTGMHQFAFGVRYADMLARMSVGERANKRGE